MGFFVSLADFCKKCSMRAGRSSFRPVRPRPPHALELVLLEDPEELDLKPGFRSPISSKKTVPPSVISNFPFFV